MDTNTVYEYSKVAFNFRTRLQDLLAREGSRDMAIILDGSYLTKSGKLVYASLFDVAGISELKFFVKSSAVPRIEELNGIEDSIIESLRQDKIYDIEFNMSFSEDDCNLIIDPDMRLIIIESPLYKLIKEIAKHKNYRNSNVTYGGTPISNELIKQAVPKFREHAYDSYKQVVYSKTSNRFVSKISKLSKFYKILKAFVPVFIHYDYLYDPLMDNPDIDISIYKMYNYAKEMNRTSDSIDSLSYYLLSHDEICRCFGMKKFVRFTPSFTYELFVGLLNPSLAYYPNKVNEAYIRAKNTENEFVSKPCFTKKDFVTIIASLRRIQEDTTKTSEEHTHAEKVLQELSTYTQSDMLHYACIRNQSLLTNYGPSILDNRENTTDLALYEYLSDASLLLN